MKTLLNKKSFISIAFSFAILMVQTSVSYAITKFDIFAPVVDAVDKIGKEKTKVEETINTQLEKQNAKINKATGSEGSALYKYITKSAAAVATSAAKGQFYASDYTASGLGDALKSELGKYKLDYATLMNQSEQYLQMREQEKINKRDAMAAELAELRAEYNSLNKLTAEEPNSANNAERIERIKVLEQAIAKQEAAIQKVLQQDTTEDATYKKMQEQIVKSREQINKLSAQFSEDAIINKLKAKTVDLFSKKAEDEHVKELYDTALGKLFLREYEKDSPENIARIMKIRKQEYYKALKNAMETVVTTHTSIEEIRERSLQCANAATKMAQGVFGASAMRVCVEIQNAKSAARYMEILLAQMRLETTKEMQNWKDKYKLSDYEKDITKFNLDDYTMNKISLYKKFKDKVNATLNDKINNFELKEKKL